MISKIKTLKKSGNSFPNKYLYLILLVLSLVFVSCSSTVIPHQTNSSEISWDSNEQNGGFVGFDKQGYGIITPNARARYNLLINKYSTNFIPSLKIDDGIFLTPTNNFRIDAQHLSYFSTMNRWRKNNR